MMVSSSNGVPEALGSRFKQFFFFSSFRILCGTRADSSNELSARAFSAPVGGGPSAD
jgi:hypothetical protein